MNRVLRLLAFVVVAVAGFAVATVLDRPVHTALAAGRFHLPEDVWQFFNAIGYMPVWWLAVLAYLLCDTARYREFGLGGVVHRARFVVLAVLLAGLVGEIMKVTVRRERPLEHGEYRFRVWGPGWDDSSGLALPSTHACVAFAGALALCALHPRAAPVWLALGLGCAWARLQVQAHFLSDVFAGGVIGLAATYLVHAWRPRPPPRAERHAYEVPKIDDGELGRTPPTALGWMNWRATLVLTFGVFLVRVAYLIWFSPYELFGDEAYYWEWSRRPDLCYYDKGPGVAWAIAAGTSVLGNTEAGVRLGAAASAALATLALAGLAASMSRDARAGFLAAAAFVLTPAYQAAAQIATDDGPLIALWIVAAWAGWRLVRRREDGRDAAADWLLFGAALGAGFLFKQSMLLLGAALPLYIAMRWRAVSFAIVPRVALAAAAFFAVISPMLVWNARHGWPTLALVLRHLGAPGGDLPQSGGGSAAGYPLRWTLELIAAQLAAFGPPLFVLIVMAIIWSFRKRRTRPQDWPAELWLMCCAAPALAVFVGVTLWKRAEGNWPFAAITTLLVLAARMAVVELVRYRLLVRAWLADPRRPRPWRGVFWRRPETLFQVGTDWVLIYGVVGWVVVAFPNLLAASAWLGPYVPQERFTGHRGRAARVDELAGRTGSLTASTRPTNLADEADPLLIFTNYQAAALHAFYGAGQPRVFNASSLLGGRRSAYDLWPDADLSDSRLRGRLAALIGGDVEDWRAALRFGSIAALDSDGRVLGGVGFGGPNRP